MTERIAESVRRSFAVDRPRLLERIDSMYDTGGVQTERIRIMYIDAFGNIIRAGWSVKADAFVDVIVRTYRDTGELAKREDYWSQKVREERVTL